MFDLTSSKLLILGIVALLVVGPKELPNLLRTVGKYVAMLRRQASEFRAQFDEAMRDTELDQIRKDMAAIKSEAHGALSEVTRSVEVPVNEAKVAAEVTAQQIDAAVSGSSTHSAPPAPAAPSSPALLAAMAANEPGATAQQSGSGNQEAALSPAEGRPS